MAKIPEKKETLLNLIDSVEITNDRPRPYLGMSSIGDECERKLFLGFHWAFTKAHNARVERIFNTGHLAEAKIICDLKNAKIKCFYRFGDEVVEMTGDLDERQEGFVDIAGHFRGHCDGRVLGIPEAPKTEHLAEMKTHNDKSFKDVVKKGVKESKPIHYAQMQIYMKYAKLNRALYIAYNKNDSSYYFERVYFDKDFAEELVEKAASIIMSESVPVCKYSQTWFSCKWCNYYDYCFGEKVPNRNCRTCDKSDICNDGKWSCQKTGNDLSYDEQLKGCRYHKFGWAL